MIKKNKTLSVDMNRSHQLKYLIYLPKDYLTKKYPLVLFLHGAGERGTNLKDIEIHGLPKLVRNGKKFPFIIIAPQCPLNLWWSDPLPVDLLSELVNDIVMKYGIHKNNVFCTGLSMGGYGTLALSIKNPKLFSAIIPICGGMDIKNFFDILNLKDLPIWLFHGDKDEVIPLENSQSIYKVLKPVNKNIKLTVYKGVDHNSWDRAYDDNELYKWMLSHKETSI
tara:strand:+ start:1811 stop:2479 length:669 start_codon:yes stop_codon:yes gene_type:complete